LNLFPRSALRERIADRSEPVSKQSSTYRARITPGLKKIEVSEES
jgi:hypothetical protein